MPYLFIFRLTEPIFNLPCQSLLTAFKMSDILCSITYMAREHTVYNCLRNLRQEKKITQEQLAKSVGVSRQTICSMEKGDYIPSLSLALLIAQFFNHPVEHVFQLKRVCE